MKVETRVDKFGICSVLNDLGNAIFSKYNTNYSEGYRELAELQFQLRTDLYKLEQQYRSDLDKLWAEKQKETDNVS